MSAKYLSRRDFLKLSAGTAIGAALLAQKYPQIAYAQTTASGDITVFWRTNPNEIATMEEAFAEFKAATGANVIFVQAPGNIEGDAKLQSLFAAGTPPEVFASVFAAGLVDYIYKDFVTDLTPLIERDDLDQSDFNPNAVETLTFGGRQYGIPRGGTVIALFYNRAMFDAAGLDYPPTSWEDDSWTWEKMLETAHALTKDTDGDGRTDEYGILIDNSNYTTFSMIPRLWGKTILPPEAAQFGLTRTHNFDDETVIEAYQRVIDLTHVEEVSPLSDFGTDLGAAGAFLTGKLGMYVGLANFPAISQAEFPWGIAALPRGAADIQQGTLTFTGPLLIGSGAPNPESGWELVKYLTSPEGQTYLYQGAVVGTSRASLYEDWLSSFSETPEALSEVLMGGYTHGIESPNVRTVQWGQILGLIRAEFDSAFLGERTAADAVAALSPQLNTLLERIYTENEEKARTIFPDFGA